MALLVVTGGGVVRADSVTTPTRTLTKLADGVYEIRHKDAPDGVPQGNTTVVIGEREVLVVDSSYLPSSAREDIAQIRRWTPKPVRYLVNTHWHYDHTMGNSTYAAAFPGLSIIAHTETRKQSEGHNPGWFEKYPKRSEAQKLSIQTGKNDEGKPLSEAELKALKQTLPGRESVAKEYKGLVASAPNLVFEQGLEVDLGSRAVQIKHLGRGNTRGDAIVYLPKEKVLVAGDLLDYPVPSLGSGYPEELITTLQKMAQLEAQTIVPGHGEVLRDHAHLNLVVKLLQTVVTQVDQDIFRLGNGPRHLDEVTQSVQKNPEIAVLRRTFTGDDKDNQEFFDNFSLPGLIQAAYAEAWGR